ncbi:MAG: hypothetical protein AAF841_00250 [Pseudomonadota bacterium]
MYDGQLSDTAALAKKVMNAIADPDQWAAVLDHILEVTPACAAIITLREKTTCQIVDDRDLEARFHSPLIRGFPTNEVAHYLQNLRKLDPWANAQRTNHPHRPTLMSTLSAPADDPRNPFFQWLTGLGVGDSVVFELDHMAGGYWTACNLFLPQSCAEEAGDLMAYAEDTFELIRSGWRASQTMQESRQEAVALLSHFSSLGRACCLVGANGDFRQGNALFDKLVDQDIVRVSGPAKMVSFSRGLKINGLERWESHDFARYTADDETSFGSLSSQSVSAEAIDPDPRFAGKRETLWLLTFGAPRIAAQGLDAERELNALTPQEIQLYREVKRGKSVKQAGVAIGVGRSRTFEVWSSVKEKLKLENSYDARR